jgi:hypothetical protein
VCGRRAKKQVAKHRTAALVHTGNLAIEDGAFHAKVFRDPCGKIRKAAILDLRRYRFGLLFVGTAGYSFPEVGNSEKLMKIVRAVVYISPLLLGPCPCAFGQNALRWEFGPSISMISLSELDSNRGFGFGARAVWNISEWLGTELQVARISDTYSRAVFPSITIRESATHYQSTANVKAALRIPLGLTRSRWPASAGGATRL